jgi:hypothetical protein
LGETGPCALSDAVFGSACASTVASSGAQKHRDDTAAAINSDRVPALSIMWRLPFASPRLQNETSSRVRSGAKKGNLQVSPGENRAAAAW